MFVVRSCDGTSMLASKINIFQFIEILLFQIGITIVIENKALMALVGTEMDWVEDDLRAEFVFNNPNSKVKKS